MKGFMLKCPKCDRYTLSEKCPEDANETLTVHPARFSPDDRYARYRSPLAYKSD